MTRARKTKSVLYAGMAAAVKAMANAHRLELLDLLGQAPRTVDVLAGLTGLSIANASQHLQVLRVAGLVMSERRGSFVSYRLAGSDVADTLVALRALAHARSAKLENIANELHGGEGVVEVDRGDLLKRVLRGDVVLVDVRPAEEFASAHLPRAVSVPLKELKARLAELPVNKTVVAYCRGPYCVFAKDAVDVLRAAGINAQALSDGVAEWRVRGLPLESAVLS